MKTIKSIISFRKFLLAFWIIGIGFVGFPCMVNAGKPIVIVIDPGHGGENLGADYNGYTEKDITLFVSQTMKAELEKFEDVTVYLTREGDESISLEDRVLFAKEKKADFLLCLHFNMSANHDVFGAEVWIPSSGQLYSEGYSMGTELMNNFTELGIFSRGIKTRLNDKGTDYYGILRHSVTQKVPAILVEHCHFDALRDEEFYTTQDALAILGRKDALAVAKYFGLHSEVLQLDFRDYTPVAVPVPQEAMAQDSTPPDVVELTLNDYNKETGELSFTLFAKDYDSSILYYAYSYDGGITWEPTCEWGAGDTVSFSFTVEEGVRPDVVAKAYNGYDRTTKSNEFVLPVFTLPKEEVIEVLPTESVLPAVIEVSGSAVSSPASDNVMNIITILVFILVALSILFLILQVWKIFIRKKRSIHRRARRIS